MSLEEAIIEALECLESPPPNEAATCDWVIVPLLLEMGYARRDIVPRMTDNHGQYPDYTIMPDTAHTWYLEAKAWSVELEDRYAVQSLNYANHNGKRWVVLSNGRIWRLYDNSVQGPVDEKLVVEVSLCDADQITAFLTALSKEFVGANRLDDYATTARLDQYLKQAISDPGSSVVNAILRVARRQPGLAGVTSRHIIDCVARATSSLTATPDIKPITEQPPRMPDISRSDIVGLDLLRNKADTLATGHKPQAIQMPDGTTYEITKWVDFSKSVVCWMASHRELPALPFKGGNKGKRCFINSMPQHTDNTPMRSAIALQCGNSIIYIETHCSAYNHIRNVYELCGALGVDPSEIRITLKP